MTSYCYFKHPVTGKLLLIANDTELVGVYFADGKYGSPAKRDWKFDPSHPILKETARQMEDFLEGRRKGFSIPLQVTGTVFQREVWKQLQAIPYGQTISYSELARRAGNPGAVRAAGTANGKNPFCIMVPCHRVIAKDGGIGGYGGGLARKRRLLEVEEVSVPEWTK